MNLTARTVSGATLMEGGVPVNCQAEISVRGEKLHHNAIAFMLSAGPDMLNALRHTLAFLECGGELSAPELCAVVEHAIAKATGGNNNSL